MQVYTVPTPSGKTYTISGPDGAPPEKQLAAVIRRHPEAANPPAPVDDAPPADTPMPVAPPTPGEGTYPAGPPTLGHQPGEDHGPAKFDLGAGLAAIPGSVEAAASAVTGMGGQLLGGLGYLAKMGLTGGDSDASLAAQKDIQDTVTYQPRTDAGKAISQMAAAPFGAVDKLAEYTGDKLGAKSPFLGAAAQTLIKGAPWIAGGAKGFMDRGPKPLEPAPVVDPNAPVPPPGPPGGPPPAQAPAAPPGPSSVAPLPTPGNRTIRAILAQMDKDGTSIGDLRDRLSGAASVGKPQSIAAVANPKGNVQGLARTMNTVPGPNRNIAVTATNDAVTGMPERVAGNIDEMAGSPGIDTEAAQASMEAQRTASAKPAYEQAYAQGALDDPELASTLESNPAYADAHAQAMKVINRSSPKGEHVQSLFDEDGKLTRAPTVQDIDVIKKGMDSKIYGASGHAMDTASAFEKMGLHPLGNARKLLMDQVDDLAPNYKSARMQFGSSLEVEHAFSDGRAMIMKGESASPFEAKQQMATLSDAGKKAYRLGVQDALRRSVFSKADTSPAGTASHLVGTGEGTKIQMIKAVFGDGAEAQKLLKQMKAEQARQQLRNQVQGGSATADKAMDVADHAVDAVTHAHSITALANHGLGKVVNAVRGKIDQTHRTNVAKELFQPRTDLDSDPFFRELQKAARRRAERNGDTGMEF